MSAKAKVLGIAAALMMSVTASASMDDAVVIDLNSANALELIEIEQLPISLASAIVRYRDENGVFKTADDLLKVPGMTSEILQAIKPEQGSDGTLKITLAEDEYDTNTMELPNY